MGINWLVNTTCRGEISFFPQFTTNAVIVDINTYNPENWRRSGYLTSFLVIDGESFIYETTQVTTGKSFIPIGLKNYRLTFTPVERFQNQDISIKIAEFDLNMYSIPPIYQPPYVGAEVITEVTPVNPSESNPIFELASPKARRAILIQNKTNKSVFVKLGAGNQPPTLTASSPFVEIPKDGSFAVEDYSGEISAIMKDNPTAGSKIIIHETPLISQ
jgi:hypothetical protein